AGGRRRDRRQLAGPGPAARGLRRVELVDAELRAVRVAGHVDEEMTEDPVHLPRRHGGATRRERRERDLELVELAVARLVDARVLRRRPDEEAGEGVRERRVVLPVAEEAAEEVRAAEERAVERMGRAEGDVVPAPRSDGAAVDQELLAREPCEPRLLVERERGLAELVPGVGGMHVRL